MGPKIILWDPSLNSSLNYFVNFKDHKLQYLEILNFKYSISALQHLEQKMNLAMIKLRTQ